MFFFKTKKEKKNEYYNCYSIPIERIFSLFLKTKPTQLTISINQHLKDINIVDENQFFINHINFYFPDINNNTSFKYQISFKNELGLNHDYNTQ